MLEELMEYDKKNDGALLKTLEVVLECNGNIKDATKKLFTHYNTIRYRVKQIETITKTSINNFEDRLNLQLALRIQKLYAILSK
jgi:purine catabolism regulator